MTDYSELVQYEKYFPSLRDYGVRYQGFPIYRHIKNSQDRVPITVCNVVEQVICNNSGPWQLWAWIVNANPAAMRSMAQVFHNVARNYGIADPLFMELSDAFTLAYGESPTKSDFLTQTRHMMTIVDQHDISAETLVELADRLLELAIMTVNVQRDIGTHQDSPGKESSPPSVYTDGTYLLEGLHKNLDKLVRGSLFDDNGQEYSCATIASLDQYEKSALNIIRTTEDQMYQEFINYEESLSQYLQLLSQTQINCNFSDMPDGLVPSCMSATPSGDNQVQISVGKFPPNNLNDPIAVKNAWDSLNTVEQEEWIRLHPEVIGNLNGIACSVRDRVNEQRLERDYATALHYLQEHNISEQELIKKRDDYRNDPQAVAVINTLQIKRGLDNQRFTAGNLHPPKPVLLLKYDPSALGWRGSAITSIGDPDTTKNIAVLVPGTGNSIFNGYLGSGDIINAAHEFTAADKDTAIISCMDYRSPDSITDSHIATTELARTGAMRIRDDVNGLWATHQGKMHMTVIGHSYGATTVADACNHGLHTNDVIFIGSPGLDQARDEHGLHLDGGHMYVGANSNDAVTYLSGFSLGNDPAALHGGGIRFHAENPHGVDPITDHSRYFDKGSESLYSMADITSGHGDQLGQHGMQTQSRHEPSTIDIVSQMLGPVAQDTGELLHSASNDHYHNPADKNAHW